MKLLDCIRSFFSRESGCPFEGKYRLRFHLAPLFPGEKDPTTGLPIKRSLVLDTGVI
ncbi:MAG: hypothetical protein CM1200mP41_20540 [Gammaproteobacteria bacterium]|nr:MAG: hypothetical protein CM1200mP41_20540 [Gammaproteobacteria bacterium]